ncbi:hypothetical protein [Streptomyces sp. NPDC048650]|uniref:hypothetical protein n=1 Tax=unclassified Streptomyces TaxID=2593676 RepID=UPI003710A586
MRNLITRRTVPGNRAIGLTKAALKAQSRDMVTMSEFAAIIGLGEVVGVIDISGKIGVIESPAERATTRFL